MPNAIALTSEYMPHRRRGTAVTTMICGFSLGAAVGGFVAAAIIPRFGWQSVFVVGGVAPLAHRGRGVPLAARLHPLSPGQRREGRRAPGTTWRGSRPDVPLPQTLSAGFDESTTHGALCGEATVHGGRAAGTALIWVVLLHEPPEPLFPEQLAADDHQRRGYPGRDGHQADGALSNRRDRRRTGAGRGARSLFLVLDPRRAATCGQRSVCSSSARPAHRRCCSGVTIASAGLGIIGGQNACPCADSRRSIRRPCARPVSAGRSASAASDRLSVPSSAGCCWRGGRLSDRCSGRQRFLR